MDLTYIFIQKENVENKNNSPVKTKYFAKTSDIRNLSQNIRADGKVSEAQVATLVIDKAQHLKISTFNNLKSYLKQ